MASERHGDYYRILSLDGGKRLTPPHSEVDGGRDLM
jgi:hypothetical protein